MLRQVCRWFLVVGFLLVSAALSVAGEDSFVVYDATFYSNKPDLTRFGLKEIRMIYASELWAYGESRAEPNVQRIVRVARNLAPDSLVCVDIEHWPLKGSPELVQQSINKYKVVAATIKEQSPSVKLGFYGALPIRDYWRAVQTVGNKTRAEWIKENDALMPMAEFVDVIFPSVYTFYDDPTGWRKYAVANLEEAAKYKKPIIPFLWPRYHNSNVYLRHTDISANFWGTQLDTCLSHADGVVIWGGGEEWNPMAAWWRETKFFIQALARPGKKH